MRRRSGAVLVLGLAAFVASWAFGSRALAPVGVGLVLVGLSARAWVRVAGSGVRLERKAGKAQSVEGDDVRIAYRLHRAPTLPFGFAYVHERVGRLGPHELRLRRGRGELLLSSVPRGRYAFEEAEVVLEDLLGLERVVIAAESGAPLVVHPRLVELDAIFSEAGRHGAAGRRLLLRRPSGFDLHSVREYEQGESLRKVHWPSTARRGRLMVKELEDSPRDDLVVLLDCAASAVAGPPGATSFDAQVRAAGSLLRAHVARGKRAALLLGPSAGRVVRVGSLDGEWPAVLDALAAAEPDGERTLAHVLADERGPAGRAPELVVVTAQLDSRSADRLAFGGAGRRVSVVWVDAASFENRPHGLAEPGLLRLASAGIPVAVVRYGDDLKRALEGAGAWRRSA